MIMKKIVKILLLLAVLPQVFAAEAGKSTVIVSTAAQRTYVYDEEGSLIRTFVCSTGLFDGDNDTPFGDYIINESGKKRGSWFFSKTYKEGAKNWVGFIGGVYLFHSIPMDENQNIIRSEAVKLGTPASHGCVRLAVDDSAWFYKNVSDGSALHIVKDFKAEDKLERCKNYKELLIPAKDMFVWLSANGKDYKQKYLLSCEIALIRTVAALNGITGISEDDILSSIPRSGYDPEKFFVCDDLNAGRRAKDGSILWNNYGCHPPVFIKELNKLNSKKSALSERADFYEEKHTDEDLIRIIKTEPDFRGAVVWLIAHTDRWGENPPVNERGMVLGEHVRFVLPALAEDGSFLIYDPETGIVRKSKSSGAARNLFGFRTVCVRKAR